MRTQLCCCCITQDWNTSWRKMYQYSSRTAPRSFRLRAATTPSTCPAISFWGSSASHTPIETTMSSNIAPQMPSAISAAVSPTPVPAPLVKPRATAETPPAAASAIADTPPTAAPAAAETPPTTAPARLPEGAGGAPAAEDEPETAEPSSSGPLETPEDFIFTEEDGAAAAPLGMAALTVLKSFPAAAKPPKTRFFEPSPGGLALLPEDPELPEPRRRCSATVPALNPKSAVQTPRSSSSS
mmetsp:Transcript_24553/g.54675  ORF Transcript_24553/g.54675 Transcript_24553/m.54675 type:complete len:241 (+) Transcript_24553:758-1480(+)